MRNGNVRIAAKMVLASSLTMLALAACSGSPTNVASAGPVRLDSLWLRLAPTGQVLVVEGLVDGGVVPVAPDVHLTIQLATDG
ncbi:MAG TPA: hypothetical protein VFW98_08710, partial [Gemmatimonadaceae bacterium]|nr:hypothetical protein [Gemmatimonadaceae bacterium]